MPHEGEYASVSKLAAAKKLNHSFISSVLRLTLLAPVIVEAILDGKQADAAQRQGLLPRVPARWTEQLSDSSPSRTRKF